MTASPALQSARTAFVRLRFPLLIGALAAALFMRLAWRTVTDADEGYYSLAGELVGDGRTLYRDFFFPQAPLVPYLLGLVWRVAHPTLRGQRMLMALFGGGTASMIAFAVRSETRSRFAALLGALFFVTHELSWQWIPMVKSYAVTTFFAVAAVVLVTRAKKATLRMCVFAGALAAMATAARLLSAPVIPVVLLAVALRETPLPFPRGLAIGTLVVTVAADPNVTPLRLGIVCLIAASVLFAFAPFWLTLRPALAVLVGVLLVALPVWFLYRLDPSSFVFGNIGYHAGREEGGLTGNPTERWETLLAVLAVNKLSTYSVAGPQFILLGVLGIVSLSQPARAFRIAPLLAGVLLVVASLTPNGLHEQYFVVAVPFFAMSAAMALGHMLTNRRVARAQRYAWPLAIGAAYALLAGPSWQRKWDLAVYDPYDMRFARPGNVERIAAAVHRAEALHPGAVLPTWPGSALGSAEHVLPGFEDHFGLKVADALTPAERAHYHIARATDLAEAVSARIPSVVVLDRELGRSGGDPLRDRTVRSGYVLFDTIAGTEIFVLPADRRSTAAR